VVLSYGICNAIWAETDLSRPNYKTLLLSGLYSQ